MCLKFLSVILLFELDAGDYQSVVGCCGIG